MKLDISDCRIFIKPGATDMRKHINGLVAFVAGCMHMNLYDDCIFVFCSKNRSMIKILYWEKNGFCLWSKRLERHKFPWPKTNKDALEISAERLIMLLKGIDFWHEHTTLHYSAVL